MKLNPSTRHHAAHPSTAVKPNLDVNKKPQAYVPPEKATITPKPSVGLDTANARTPVGEVPSFNAKRDAASVSDPDSPDYDPDSTEYDEDLDDSQ